MRGFNKQSINEWISCLRMEIQNAVESGDRLRSMHSFNVHNQDLFMAEEGVAFIEPPCCIQATWLAVVPFPGTHNRRAQMSLRLIGEHKANIETIECETNCTVTVVIMNSSMPHVCILGSRADETIQCRFLISERIQIVEKEITADENRATISFARGQASKLSEEAKYSATRMVDIAPIPNVANRFASSGKPQSSIEASTCTTDQSDILRKRDGSNIGRSSSFGGYGVEQSRILRQRDDTTIDRNRMNEHNQEPKESGEVSKRIPRLLSPSLALQKPASEMSTSITSRPKSSQEKRTILIPRCVNIGDLDEGKPNRSILVVLCIMMFLPTTYIANTVPLRSKQLSPERSSKRLSIWIFRCTMTDISRRKVYLSKLIRYQTLKNDLKNGFRL